MFIFSIFPKQKILKWRQSKNNFIKSKGKEFLSQFFPRHNLTLPSHPIPFSLELNFVSWNLKAVIRYYRDSVALFIPLFDLISVGTRESIPFYNLVLGVFRSLSLCPKNFSRCSGLGDSFLYLASHCPYFHSRPKSFHVEYSPFV